MVIRIGSPICTQLTRAAAQSTFAPLAQMASPHARAG